MPFPGVSVQTETGNLLRALANMDNQTAVVISVATEGLQGVVTTVFSLKDAESKGITAAAEPFLHEFLTAFYTELAGNKKLYVFGYANTSTMASMLAVTNEDSGAFKMIKLKNGEITHLAVLRKPDAAYDPGEDFLDEDVAAALTAAKGLCQYFQSKNQPLRVLIEGRVVDGEVANTLEPNTLSNGYCGVVIGGTKADGSASVALALARIAKFPAHVKIGSGENGPLSASAIFIGEDPIEERSDVEDLHDQGFITFHRRPGIAGYYFGVDNMCTNDDTRILVNGSILDKAQRIAAATYTPYLETDVRLNNDGTINETDAKHIEDVLKTAILANMAGQISNADVIIDRDQIVAGTNKISVKVKILPLGYLTWIEVTLGLTSSL
ncbi:MAG: DUF2586 family protein [Lentimicrobium sp.]|jgi:hypothetical protein|nr:DUF2586 family protein [Lentimicrobium sp.]